MYSKNGSFGQVRLAYMDKKEDHLFSLSSCGWHKCNDQYRIDRRQDAEALFLYTVSGCGEMCIAGKSTALPAGTVAYIPQGAWGHYCTPRGGLWEFYWIHPCSKAVDLFLKVLKNEAIWAKADPGKDYDRRMEDIIRLCHSQNERAALELSLNLSELLHLFTLDLKGETAPLSLPQKVIGFFNTHLGEPITVKEVAAASYISEAHLIRVFKKEQGVTPHAYLMGLRLRYAQRLLKLDMSVGEVASAAGFCSATHLITAFKKAYGITPADFARQVLVK